MPALANIRHEEFCRLLVKGLSKSAAYERVGYAPSRAHASRLAANGNVKARLEQLRGDAARRHQISLDSLIEELAAWQGMAVLLQKPSIGIAATCAKARLCGYLPHRNEAKTIEDINGFSSVDEVMRFIRATLGDAITDQIEELMRG